MRSPPVNHNCAQFLFAGVSGALRALAQRGGLANPMNELESIKLPSFLVLSDSEFAAGSAEWNGDHVMIGHYVHIAGKEFEDVRNDLKSHLDVKIPIAAQLSLPVSITTVIDKESPSDLLSRLSKASGLASNNIHIFLADRKTGEVLKIGRRRANALAIGISKVLLAKYRAELTELGIPCAIVSCRILNAIGALRDAMSMGEAPSPVLCASMLFDETQLFYVTPDEVVELGEVAYGFMDVLREIMKSLELKFEGSAARLFFGNIYDFDDMGDALSGPLSMKIRERLAKSDRERPLGIMISGLPPARTRMFSRHVSMALGINQLSLPILVEATDGGLPAMPAVGAPSIVRMLMATGNVTENPFLNIDLAKIPLDVTEYWWPEEEPVAQPVHKFVRMYRGNYFDENGNPIEKPHEESVKKAAPARKIIRYYRGTPVYED
jgi:hypothetical protein